MSTATSPRMRQRTLKVQVSYGEPEVERAAEKMNVSVSDEEMDAILARVDEDLSMLVNAAAQSLVAARIYEYISGVARGHASSDDD